MSIINKIFKPTTSLVNPNLVVNLKQRLTYIFYINTHIFLSPSTLFYILILDPILDILRQNERTRKYNNCKEAYDVYVHYLTTFIE